MAQPTVLLATDDFTGMPVISSDNGKQNGQVSDVVLDPKQKKISALLINSDDPNSAKAVSFKDVSEIVSNTIFVKNEQAIKPAQEVVKLEQKDGKASQFAQQRVVSDKGKELGKVVDFYFDPIKGEVKQIEYITGQNGKSQRVRLEAKEIKFKEDFVEVKPKTQSKSKGNVLKETVQSIKEKIA